MKQFLLTLVAVLIGGFLALLGYDRFVVKPREAAATTRAQAEALVAAHATAQLDLGKARSEARAVAAEVEASVQRSVENARQTMDAQASEMNQRGLVADAVQRASMFRVALTEYYQTNGRWPTDADEAGLPSPSEMRGGAVRTVTLGAQGAVTIALDDRFGVGSVVILKPDVNAASGIVDWNCEVKGDAALKQAMPRCKG
jgi:Pilin (bacterial filament)